MPELRRPRDAGPHRLQDSWACPAVLPLVQVPRAMLASERVCSAAASGSQELTSRTLRRTAFFGQVAVIASSEEFQASVGRAFHSNVTATTYSRCGYRGATLTCHLREVTGYTRRNHESHE